MSLAKVQWVVWVVRCNRWLWQSRRRGPVVDTRVSYGLLSTYARKPAPKGQLYRRLARPPTSRIANRKYAAPTHKKATVAQETKGACSAKTPAGADAGVGTTLKLFTAACITIVSNRLPRVRQYSHA